MKPTRARTIASPPGTLLFAILWMPLLAVVNDSSAQSDTSASPMEASPRRTSRPQQFANLGQLLNAGGKLLAPRQFREEVAQRMLVGTFPSGSTVEIMYTSSGAIAGNLLVGHGGSDFGGRGGPQNWPVSGSWKVDDSERICTSLLITGSQASTIVPARCEFWFKLLDTYYVSDSDEDRSAKLAVRVLKQ